MKKLFTYTIMCFLYITLTATTCDDIDYRTVCIRNNTSDTILLGTVFLLFQGPKKFGKGPPRAPTARRKISLATRNFSISKKKQRPIWAKKEEKAFCLRALSSSLYKYTTFFGKKQIVLTFEYNP